MVESAPEPSLLICQIRIQRFKARRLALAEAAALLQPFAPVFLDGGPLGDRRGVFWLTLPPEHLPAVVDLLPRFGFVEAVDTLEPIAEADWRRADVQLVRWQQRPYRIVRLYEEDAAVAAEHAPHSRRFLLATRQGPQWVRGYRGDGRRALQFYDARLLVNLTQRAGGRLLDPFVGAGSIAIAALQAGFDVWTGDYDPVLVYGIQALGAQHMRLDVLRLPLCSQAVDCIVTEPPYDESALPIVCDGLLECARVLQSGGVMVTLCADWQADALRATAGDTSLQLTLDLPLNRKGIKSTVLRWEKP